MVKAASKPATATPGKTYLRVGECLWRNTASGIYYAFVKRGGKQFHHSLKTRDRALAERRLSSLRNKITRLSHSKESTSITFAVLAARWLETVSGNMKPSSALRRSISINQLNKFFVSKPVRNITARDCDEWLIKRGKNISASSYNNERDTLRRIFEFAKRDGIILESPTGHIPRRKLTKATILIPTKEQFRALIVTIRDGDDRATSGADLVELLAYSGTVSKSINSCLPIYRRLPFGESGIPLSFSNLANERKADA